MTIHATTRTRRHLARRAFTLIELMIVVAIVGILAVLGIVGYRKLILAAHTSEATHMVQSIRVAEEAYHAEAQTYVSTSADGFTGLYPTLNDPPGAWKSAWTTPTTGCASALGANVPGCFALLPVHADGPVAYGYATLAGPAGIPFGALAAAPSGLTLQGPPGISPVDWYWITATGNPNGDSNHGTWSFVVANSATNDLFVQDQ